MHRHFISAQKARMFPPAQGAVAAAYFGVEGACGAFGAVVPPPGGMSLKLLHVTRLFSEASCWDVALANRSRHCLSLRHSSGDTVQPAHMPARA